MARYGIPYKGSKNLIAKDILNVLPSGNRLVDLFGGGFAITHCAMLEYPDKWKSFYYSDKNPQVVNLVKDAISGKYNYKVFKPVFVTREMFFKNYMRDGYVRYIWSFGNNGKSYLFGKDKEHMKHIAHDYVVFGKKDNELYELMPRLDEYVTSEDIHERRLQFYKAVRAYKLKREQLEQLQQLEQLERLQQLQQLERLQQLEQLERLQQLEIVCADYRDYIYRDGDVVYCDIPYQFSQKSKEEYLGGFDHEAFYEWARRRPYDVYFSSYGIPDNVHARCIWEKEKYATIATGNSVKKLERLYAI